MEKGIEYIETQMTNLKKEGSDVAMDYYWSLNKILRQVNNQVFVKCINCEFTACENHNECLKQN